MSKDTFGPNECFCVNYPLNIFHKTHGFENWGIGLGYFPVFFYWDRYSVT